MPFTLLYEWHHLHTISHISYPILSHTHIEQCLIFTVVSFDGISGALHIRLTPTHILELSHSFIHPCVHSFVDSKKKIWTKTWIIHWIENFRLEQINYGTIYVIPFHAISHIRTLARTLKSSPKSYSTWMSGFDVGFLVSIFGVWFFFLAQSTFFPHLGLARQRESAEWRKPCVYSSNVCVHCVYMNNLKNL